MPDFPFSVGVTILAEHQPIATINLGGASYQFVAAQGEAVDPYFDPVGEFVMDNIICTHPGLPGFRAYYRPDRASTREEWVFEYGDPWITPVPANLVAYTAVITRKDGSTVTVAANKGHYWHARWRWQSAVRRVRRNAEQLWNQDLICHWDVTGLVTGGVLTVGAYEPMLTCGMPTDQGQTGGYPGLGIETGWQTQYLVRNAPETSFRNQGEAAGSYQSHVRDTKTGAPIDIVNDYPDANMYASNTGSPYFAKGTVVNRTDQGHMPSAAYLPWLLTGDPYYLEEMQFWSNHNMLSLPGNGSRFMVMGRYLAWPLRAIFECFLTTPDAVPSWLLPKSYWLHWLDVCRGFVEDRMMNTSDPIFYVFHTIPEGGQTTTLDPAKSGDHVWQQNMLDLVAAWIACLRDEWIEPAEWLMHSSVDRASATSGWCRARCSPYHMRFQNVSVLAEAMTKTSTTMRLQYAQRFKKGMVVKIDSENFTLAETSDNLTWTFAPRVNAADHPVNREVWGPKCTSWAEAADLNILTYGWAADVADNDHMAPSATDLTYQGYQRAALAQGLRAGLEVPGLTESAKWMDDEIRRLIAAKQVPGLGDNWCAMPAVTRRRRHVRRSDRTDYQLRPELLELLDELRGVD